MALPAHQLAKSLGTIRTPLLYSLQPSISIFCLPFLQALLPESDHTSVIEGNPIPPPHHYLDHAICLLNALPASTLAPHSLYAPLSSQSDLLKNESNSIPPGLTSPKASGWAEKLYLTHPPPAPISSVSSQFLPNTLHPSTLAASPRTPKTACPLPRSL